LLQQVLEGLELRGPIRTRDLLRLRTTRTGFYEKTVTCSGPRTQAPKVGREVRPGASLLLRVSPAQTLITGLVDPEAVQHP